MNTDPPLVSNIDVASPQAQPSSLRTSGTKTFPQITPVQWLPARDVLGGEATDFTPWLVQPESLEILAAALKLEELTAVAAEHSVLGKKLDILATALDESGNEVAVCIENQYGVCDADHLGRLIAYLAQHERGRAVWIVERAHDAFVAAVRFLNRTSSDDVGYYLVQVRFTHGAAGGYQVHFEVLAAPIAWEKGGKKAGGTKAPINVTKKSYLDEIHHKIADALLDSGFSTTGTHIRGAYLWTRWPPSLWFRAFSRGLDIRANKSEMLVAVIVNLFDSKDANTAAIGVLRGRYEAALRERLPENSVMDWTSVGAGHRSLMRVELPGAGYENGNNDAAAEWALAVATAWLNLLAEDPIEDFEQLVLAQVPSAQLGSSADDEDEVEDG